VYGWLAGSTPVEGRLAAPHLLAEDLARLVTALHALPTDGAPSTDRGVPLADRDEGTREALRALADMGPDASVDLRAAERAWDAAVAVPPWDGPPVWLHGDLGAGNLLLDRDRLHAVIDFGLTGIGDPAADLVVAWNLLPAAQRGRFAAAVAVDADTWARGRGWALSRGLVALPYYARRHPPLAASARSVIAAVLNDLADRDPRDPGIGTLRR
jgi:aminoglycoside phosphotransferase (APT) family kinase protein